MSDCLSPENPPPSPTWGEIEPSLLEDVRAPVPAFPLDLLPPFWPDWVGATARSAGAPADYVALSVLAAVAGLAGARVRVCLTPHWAEPLVLWQALVGGPSSGKSAAMAPLRDLLAALEPNMPAPGGQKPGRVVEDAGIDEVVAALDSHPRGVIVWRDEPTDLLAGLGVEQGQRGGEALRACWLQAWSGGPVTPGKGERRLKQFPVSLLFALRPERAAELVGAGDDLAARFLFTWPCTSAPVPLAARAHTRSDEAVLDGLRRTVDRLSGEPLDLVFDEWGVGALDGLTGRLQAERGEAEGLEAAWLGKGEGTAARLAGVLHLLEWSRSRAASMPAVIPRHTVEHAIALWSDYFRPHALALFHRLAPTEQDRRARQVVRWLRTWGLEQVSREEIRCKALRHAVNAHQAEQVLVELQKAGVVEPASRGGPPAPGRPPDGGGSIPACSKRPFPETPQIHRKPERHTMCGGSILSQPQGQPLKGALIQDFVVRACADHKRVAKRLRKFQELRKLPRHHPLCRTRRVPSAARDLCSCPQRQLRQWRQFTKPSKNGHRRPGSFALRQLRQLRQSIRAADARCATPSLVGTQA